MTPVPPNGSGRVQIPQPRDLQTIVREAEAATAGGDAASALSLLRELTAWVSLRLNPVERQRAAGMIRDPAALAGLVSLPVTLQRAPQPNGTPQPSTVMDSPNGPLVVVPMIMVMPLANLATSRVRMTMGEDPLIDMLPLLDARMVLPRESMRKEVMDVVEGRAATPAGG